MPACIFRSIVIFASGDQMRTVLRAVVRFLNEADILLLVFGLVSSVYGIILIASVLKRTGGTELLIQIGALVIGVVLFVLFSYIDIDIIADKYGFLLVFSLLFLLTLQFWGVGQSEVGNRAWLRFFNIGIQPSEIVKVTFTIIIARMIVNYRERKTLNSFVSLIQILLVFAAVFAMIVYVSMDLGSALVYLFILAAMLFIGGVKLRWFALGIAVIAAASPLIWNSLADYQKNRVLAPFIPDQIDPDRQGVLWQSSQSVRAISSGGFTGQGLGNGRMTQTGLVPAQKTDFIFSAAGEELGFIGCMIIVILLVAIIARCIYIGVKSNNLLGLLVCTGIAAMFIAQSIENIGMCLGLFPVIGITLPFFSYGGSSLVTGFASLGIVSGIKMRPKSAKFRTF